MADFQEQYLEYCLTGKRLMLKEYLQAARTKKGIEMSYIKLEVKRKAHEHDRRGQTPLKISGTISPFPVDQIILLTT